MPNLSAIVARFTGDKILYWQKNGSNDAGKPVFATPIPLLVRWEDKQKEIVLPDGRKVMSKGYLLLSTELSVGGLVWLGTLTDWQNQTYFPLIPTVNQGVRELIMVNRTPGIKQLPGNVVEAYF